VLVLLQPDEAVSGALGRVRAFRPIWATAEQGVAGGAFLATALHVVPSNTCLNALDTRAYQDHEVLSNESSGASV